MRSPAVSSGVGLECDIHAVACRQSQPRSPAAPFALQSAGCSISQAPGRRRRAQSSRDAIRPRLPLSRIAPARHQRLMQQRQRRATACAAWRCARTRCCGFELRLGARQPAGAFPAQLLDGLMQPAARSCTRLRDHSARVALGRRITARGFVAGAAARSRAPARRIAAMGSGLPASCLNTQGAPESPGEIGRRCARTARRE